MNMLFHNFKKNCCSHWIKKKGNKTTRKSAHKWKLLLVEAQIPEKIQRKLSIYSQIPNFYTIVRASKDKLNHKHFPSDNAKGILMPLPLSIFLKPPTHQPAHFFLMVQCNLISVNTVKTTFLQLFSLFSSVKLIIYLSFISDWALFLPWSSHLPT